jgi:hypothetical protein
MVILMRCGLVEPSNVCDGCKEPGHVVMNCYKTCRYCHEKGHSIEDCFKLKWKKEQCFSGPDDDDDKDKNGNGKRPRLEEYKPSFEMPEDVRNKNSRS